MRAFNTDAALRYGGRVLLIAAGASVSAMSTNRHPVDELHDIRAEIRALEEREAQLRAKLLAGECGLVGDSFIAQISMQTKFRFNLRAARRMLVASVLAPFTTPRQVQVVRLAARDIADEGYEYHGTVADKEFAVSN
jgi:hypothetical protein